MKVQATVVGNIDTNRTQMSRLRESQRRCQQLGATAASDAECLRVWAETRDRFLRPSSASASPAMPEGR